MNKDDIFKILRQRPKAESLDFNKPRGGSQAPQTVISADEKINMDVFETVHPAVVNIVTTTLGVNFWMEIIPREGQGSGFIIDRNGYILTNSHVVANAQSITVTTSGEKKVRATLVGRDPGSDLAVIKIPSSSVETIVPLGDSDKVRVGQKAIAIGNPFGLSHTLTTGIVSALNRSIRTDEKNRIDNLIQTDAAINPGNSGGPLLNSNGEVIGINTAIISLSGGYQGIGFAIPINYAKEIATKLITAGKVARPWMGLSGLSVTKELSDKLGLAVDKGVLIIEIIADGPADQAGLRGGDKEVIIDGARFVIGGDIVVSVNNKEIPDMKSLVGIIEGLNAGESVDVKISRNDNILALKVLLSERP